MDVRVTEIFCSVQGESSYAGVPCAFVRLARCNLRCGYCDTPYSFGSGTRRTVEDILAEIEGFGVRLCCITGGEPMLQPEAVAALAHALIDRGWTVQLETNGTIPLEPVPSEVVKVVDVKTPGALRDDPRFRHRHFCYTNLEQLTPRDEVKLVVTSRADYEWCRDFIREHALHTRAGQVLLSPSWGEVEPKELVEWMLADRLPGRLNLQIHKLIWGADATGV